MKKTNVKGQTRTISMKFLAVLLSAGLLVGGVVGGTVAWLTTKTDDVINTFTTSDINITLEETTTEYKMIPGWTIAKDPKATVAAGSEDCYLFVKAEKSDNFDDFMTYTIAEGWTVLGDETDVYYRVIDSDEEREKAYSILAGDQVTVKDDVTKENMEALTEDTKPALTFTAYASQLYKSNTETFTAAEAWRNLNSASSGSVTTE